MKLFCLAIFLTFISCFDACSQNGQRAIDFYAAAVRSFNASGYAESIKLASQAETLLGRTTAVTTALKVRNYFALKEYERVTALLSDFYKLNAHPDLVQEMFSYASKVDKRALQKSLNRSLQRVTAASTEYLDVRLHLTGLYMKPDIQQTLSTLERLKPGYVYIFDRKRAPATLFERSYFVFYDDRYILCTLPNPSTRLLAQARHEKVGFGTDEVERYEWVKGSTIVSWPLQMNGGSEWVSFRKSIHYSNVFIGGRGDELLWTGSQYNTFDKTLFYFFYNNFFVADIKLEAKDPKEFRQPLFETGRIERNIDFRMVRDENLLNALKNAGFKNVSLIDQPSSRGMSIVARGDYAKRHMLFTVKKLRYQLKEKLKGTYMRNSVGTKGEFLYYKPISGSTHYAFTEYTTADKYHAEDLLRSLAESDNNVEISKDAFDDLYKIFSKQYGENVTQTFSSSAQAYSRPMDFAVTMSRVIPGSGKSLFDTKPVAKKTAEAGGFQMVIEKAAFPGGAKALSAYLKKSVYFPHTYSKKRKVMVEVLISQHGFIEEVKVVDSAGAVLDLEASQAAWYMPNWIPARQNGKPVPFRVTLPISFSK